MGVSRRRVLAGLPALGVAGAACGVDTADGRVADRFATVATVRELAAALADGRPLEVLDHKLWPAEWDPTEPAMAAWYGEATATMPDGTAVIALAMKCPHLGCRLPWCEASGWFECPCHFARFLSTGQLVDGQIEVGMSWFETRITGDDVEVAIAAPRRGTPVSSADPQADGPHCVDF